MRQLEYQSELMFIKMRDLKDDEAILKENKEPATKNYEEITKKIQLHESITNILLKF